MDKIIVWYLRMSVFYFAAGALLGAGMLLWPYDAGYYIPAHVHLNLLGFMSMMIYGVGYHILPRFSGVHIYSPAIVTIQFWLANAGLLMMAISWPFHEMQTALSLIRPLLMLSALLTLIAVVLFTYNILKTIKPMDK
ncbi:MAG: hypothetical protein HZA10_06865 [Nitrospirae bacterium]|nr:hypothetical protein [Nitrospirota bacterium]